MFTFPEVGSLSDVDARRALEDPAAEEGVTWDPRALDQVLALTEGYPYFIQEFGKQSWDVADGSTAITASDAERAVPLAMAELDSGFFQVRTGRLTDNERTYWDPDRCARLTSRSCWARTRRQSERYVTVCSSARSATPRDGESSALQCRCSISS